MAESTAIAALLLLAAAGAVLAPLFAAGARALALFVMLAVLVLALRVFVAFDGGADAARFAVEVAWMPSRGIDLKFGVDGFNVYLLLLTALLFPVALMCAWTRSEAQSRLYLSLMLALEAGLLGTFLAKNLVILFVCWEAVLIPMALLILVFGGDDRRGAALTFFITTMAGSVLFLAAVILLGVASREQTGAWSFDLDTLRGLQLSPGRQAFVFGAIALACAIKCPLVPFHAWLPRAYGAASAPTAALMAGVMSKMGAFGFVKLAIPLAPAAAAALAPAMVALAVASILYGAVLALRQTHFKQLVAYASLSHMGYIVLGLFSLQATAVHGALLQILSHGLAVAGLFLLLGLLEQRCGPAYLQLDALASRAPRLAVTLMLFILASLALPLTSGFTAEFLVLLGALTQGLAAWRADAGSGLLVLALAAALGVVLGATYMLRLARALVFGDAGATRAGAGLPDLAPREGLALAPLLLLILWIGVWPAPFMTKVESEVARQMGQHTGAGALTGHGSSSGLLRAATVAASPSRATTAAAGPLHATTAAAGPLRATTVAASPSRATAAAAGPLHAPTLAASALLAPRAGTDAQQAPGASAALVASVTSIAPRAAGAMALNRDGHGR